MTQKIRWKIAQVLEARWWRAYTGGKDPEAYLNWKKNYWLKFLEEVDIDIMSLKNAYVLDAGCGPAGIFTVMPCKTFALDPLLEEYSENIVIFKKESYPHVEFLSTRIEDLTLENCFDLIFCINAINHVEDIRNSTESLYKACKTGGRMIISTDAHRYSWLKYIFRLIPGDALHPHQYDLKEYMNIIREAGFRIDSFIIPERHQMFDYVVITASKN